MIWSRPRLASLADATFQALCLLALCPGVAFLLLMMVFMWRAASLGAHFGINLYDFRGLYHVPDYAHCRAGIAGRRGPCLPGCGALHGDHPDLSHPPGAPPQG